MQQRERVPLRGVCFGVLATLRRRRGLFSGGDLHDDFGLAVACPGDVNADGRDDLVIGAPSAQRVHVVFGAPDLSSTSRVVVSAPAAGASSSFFGSAVGGAGDVDGDGVADLVVGAWDAFGGDGAAWVFTGGVMVGERHVQLDGRNSAGFGIWLAVLEAHLQGQRSVMPG